MQEGGPGKEAALRISAGIRTRAGARDLEPEARGGDELPEIADLGPERGVD
jgi:hypothetical protein